jgi:DMSO/TMAO reductase YedYZ molybdopterin-dependent catalytic subunit
MEVKMTTISRRMLLSSIGTGGAGLLLAKWLGEHEQAQEPRTARNIPPFTGPGPNSFWNSVGPVVNEPQKAPLILLTDRPVQLETPRHYFSSMFTPNEAFYVRWHLDGIPNALDLKEWRLRVEGSVEKPLTLSLPDL